MQLLGRIPKRHRPRYLVNISVVEVSPAEAAELFALNIHTLRRKP